VPAVELSAEHLMLLQMMQQQPFFYLGEGRQCVAYESQQYVLKFLKHVKKKRKEKKVQESVQGALLAWKEIPEATGILVCVFTPQNKATLPSVTLFTKRGTLEHVALGESAFFVQQKALSLKKVIFQLAFSNRLDEAKMYLDSLFSLLSLCRDKGIADRDGSLIRNGNLGVIGKKVVLIDTGKLQRCSDRKRQTLHDLNRLKPMISWLKTVSPELASHFCDKMKKYREEM
jgi:hypothetical protein